MKFMNDIIFDERRKGGVEGGGGGLGQLLLAQGSVFVFCFLLGHFLFDELMGEGGRGGSGRSVVSGPSYLRLFGWSVPRSVTRTSPIVALLISRTRFFFVCSFVACKIKK